MLHRSLFWMLAASIGLCSFFACSPQTPLPLTGASAASPGAEVSFSKLKPRARIQPGSIRGQRQDLGLRIAYPTRNRQGSPAFATQAFACETVAFVKVWVAGLGMEPIYARDADEQQMVPVDGCNAIHATLPAVPFGKARVVTIELYDSGRNLVAGSTIKAGLDVVLDLHELEVGFRTTPAARIIEKLLGMARKDQALLNGIDPALLQQKVDALIKPLGSYPDYAYDIEPELLDIDAITGMIIDGQGQLPDLSPHHCVMKTGSLRLSVSGLRAATSILASLDDPSSQNRMITADGDTLMPDLPPGTWTLRADGPGYATESFQVSISEEQETHISLILRAPAPTGLGLIPTQGYKGDAATITGSGFGPSNEYTAFFDALPATITGGDDDELHVIVPAGASRVEHVTLKHGDSAPGTAGDYTVLQPANLALSPPAGIVGSTVTITGIGFSTTKSDNLVSFDGIAAVVLSATAEALTVEVPYGAYGGVEVSVKVRGSDTVKAGDYGVIPQLTSLDPSSGQGGASVTLHGTGFHPTAGQNSVSVDGQGVSVDGVSTLDGRLVLTVKAPAGTDGTSQAVTNTVAGRASNSLDFGYSSAVPRDRLISDNSRYALAVEMTMNPAGRHVIIWSSQSSMMAQNEIKTLSGQITDASGNRVGLPFPVNTTPFSHPMGGALPRVDMAADGSFIVVWSDVHSFFGPYTAPEGYLPSYRAQRFDAAGQKVGDELILKTWRTGYTYLSYPAVTLDDDGSFVLAWREQEDLGSSYGPNILTRAQRFSADNVGGPVLTVNDTATTLGSNVMVDSDGNGRFLVTWSQNLTDIRGRYYQLVEQNDTPLNASFLISSIEAGTLGTGGDRLLMNASGQVLLSYMSSNTLNAQNRPVLRYKVARYAFGATSPLETPFEPPYETGPNADNSGFLGLGLAPDGQFVIAWEEGILASEQSIEILAQRYQADGSSKGGTFKAHVDASGRQTGSVLGLDGNQTLIHAFTGNRDSSSRYSAYSQRFNAADEAQYKETLD